MNIYVRFCDRKLLRNQELRNLARNQSKKNHLNNFIQIMTFILIDYTYKTYICSFLLWVGVEICFQFVNVGHFFVACIKFYLVLCAEFRNHSKI